MTIAVGPSDGVLLSSGSGCQLGNGVEHVFYIGFDNFHMRRDNSSTVANNGDDNRNTDANIPSDLEQVPALYNFLRGSTNAGSTTDATNYADGRNTGFSDNTPFPGGTILGNHHTPLISHTSVDFTAAYSGVYGDRNGIATAQNNIAAYNGAAYSSGSASAVGTNSNGGFGLWTDPLNIGTDTTPQFLTQGSSSGVNAPAPWVPFTRAGCDVGAVAATTMVLENNNSLATANGLTPGANFTSADEGLAVHCAPNSAVCGLASSDPTNIKATPDNLPAEPGAPYNGTAGYYALFGHRFIASALNDRLNNTTSGGSTTLSLLRAPSTNGWPGFNGEDGNYTLGYDLAMQKAGIPVTFGYLTTPHNCYTSLDGANSTGWTSAYDDYNAGGTIPASNPCDHTDASSTSDSGTSSSFGSGEQGYVNYLHQLNSDFQTFFDNAKAAGYTTANTEFVFYSDENDHTAEATPANSTCDGVTVACQYNHASAGVTPNTPGQMGEVTVKLDNSFPNGWGPTGTGFVAPTGTTSYTVLNDSAPDFYVQSNGSSGPPAQSDPNVRSFERSVGNLTYTNPYDGTVTKLGSFEADQAGLNALHMVTADPNRTPSFDVFAPGEDFVEFAGRFNGSDCGSTANVSCTNAGFVGVHGDFAPETTTTWAGFAGPGIANLGSTNTFTDHVDLRHTLLAVLGLQDDYTDQGRVITEILNPGAVNAALGDHTSPATNDVQALGGNLKAIDAPNYGAVEGLGTNTSTGFGPAILVADTTAVQSNSPSDSTWTDVEGRISHITALRNTVVSNIQSQLLSAENGTPVDHPTAQANINDAQCVLAYANQLKVYAANPITANAPTDCTLTGGPSPGVMLPEVGHAALFIIGAGGIVAGALLLSGRRRRGQTI